jgi:hypothetical protein
LFGLALAVVVGGNVWLAYRLRPPFRPVSQEQENLERYRVSLEPRKRLIFGALLIVLFVGAGIAAQQNWQTWQLWRFGESFGVKDPQFHRDISFFAWDYPAYRVLLGFGFNMVIFSLLLSLAVHYVFGAFRIATPGPRFTISARRHITILVFFFIVLKACAYWLDRYGLVFAGRAHVTGASYTDVNATLPAKTILFYVAILIALGVLASLWLKSAQIPVISFIVLLVLSIGINGIYPALVQQISVKPNASQKEAPYIARNIEATRQAYDIVSATDGGNVNYVNYGSGSATATLAQAGALTDSANAATVGNIRLLDPNVVGPTFTQLQRLKNVYGFQTKLDIDRYADGSGQVKDYVVGVRELNAANLSGDQTNWINQHSVYTHGYGFVAAEADKALTNSSDFAEGNIPPSGFLTITQPQIYYGELGVDYSIVGAQGGKAEYDGSDQTTTYAGKGGVSLSSLLTRTAFAIKYRQTNFLLNNTVSAQGAKVIFDRDPRQRVEKVAPYLTVDSDPYPAVINGRIVWMLDGYTTMNNYPYSQQEQLGSLTASSLATNNRTARQADTNVNYIRNSVKATVDAYDGTVHLYQWDDTDPVLKTWMKVFPGTVEPKSAIPQGVLDHIRYPEDLFEVQRALLAKYHVSDPVQFYNVRDQWTVPSDPYAASGDQPPYYLLAGNPTDPSQTEYQLTSPMRVNSNENLAAYISVSSQAQDYGRFTVLKVPSGSQTFGPTQVANQFKSETAINTEVSLFDQNNSQVVYGNLLSLPIGNNFLYVEPLYVQGSGASQPVLRRVILFYGNRVGYGVDLPSALRNLTQGRVGQEISTSDSSPTSPTPPTSPSSSTAPSSPSPPTASSTPTPVPSDVGAIVTQLDQALADLQSAYKTGDFSKIGAAQERVKQLTDAFVKAQASASHSPKPSTSPS